MNKADALVLKVTVENQQAIAGMAQVSKATQDTAKTSETAMAKQQSAWQGAMGAWRAAGVAIGTVTAAVYVLNRVMERATLVTNVSTAFNTLTARVGETSEAMLATLRPATRGLISDMELMRQTNAAVILGLPVTSQKMGELAEISIKLGRAMGQDAKTSLESLVIGIGRQSRLWLDNIGIVVDADKAYSEMAKTLGKTVEQLTEAERKLAFFNETLKQGKISAQGLTESGWTLGKAWQSAGVDIGNTLDKLRRVASEFPRYSPIVGVSVDDINRRHDDKIRASLGGSNQFEDRPEVWNQSFADAALVDLKAFTNEIENQTELRGKQVDLLNRENDLTQKRYDKEHTITEEMQRQIDLQMASTGPTAGLGGALDFKQGVGAMGAYASFIERDDAAFADRQASIAEEAAAYGELLNAYNEVTLGLYEYQGAAQSVDETLQFMLASQTQLGESADFFLSQNQATVDALFEQAQAAEWTAAKYDLVRAMLYDVSDAMLNWAMTGEMSLKGLVNAVARSTFSILSALAIEAVIRGFMEAAKATAAAASFNYYGATMHAAAAAQFFATAGKAGVGAGAALIVAAVTRPDDRERKESGGSSAFGSDGRRGSLPTATDPGGSQNITIVLEGDGFIYSTPEELARQIEDAMRRARGRSGGN